MGLRTIALFAAPVTMPAYTDPALRQDRWALYIGSPKDAGSCKRLPTQGGTVRRHAQAPPHAAPTHGAEPFFSGCSRPFSAHGALILRLCIERNARHWPYLSHSLKGGFITATGWFVFRCTPCLVLPTGSQAGASFEATGVLSTGPSSFGSLALASRQYH